MRGCEEHLQTCASCRAELAELRSLQTEIYEVCAETAAAEPTLGTFHRARIRLTNSSGDRPPSLLGRLAHRLRPLFEPQWVPAVAMVLVLLQSGALIWLAQRSSNPSQITTRGLAAPRTRATINSRILTTARAEHFPRQA